MLRIITFAVLSLLSLKIYGATDSVNLKHEKRLLEFAENKTALPFYSINKLANPPKIDGKMSPGEWNDAAAIVGMRNFHTGLLVPRNKSIFVRACYDDKNLYFLLIMPYALPAAPKRADDNLQIFRDNAVTELMFFSPGDAGTRRFAVSASGSKVDMIDNKADFNSGFIARVGTYKDATASWVKGIGLYRRFHFIEISIPRDKIVMKNNECKFNIFQIANGYFTLSPVVKAANEPAGFATLRLLEPGTPVFASWGLGNPSDGDFRVAGTVERPGKKNAEVEVDLFVFKRGTHFRVNTGYDEVVGALETFKYRSINKFRRQKFRPKNRQCDFFDLQIKVNNKLSMRIPGPMKVSPPLELTIKNFPGAKKIQLNVASFSKEPVQLTLNGPDGKTIWRKSGQKGIKEIDYTKYTPGLYRIDAVQGKFSAKTSFRVNPRPEWLNNNLGKADVVLKPFKPLKLDKRSVSMWNRRYIWDDSSVIFNYESAGVKPLQQAPRLVAVCSGKREAIKLTGFKVIKNSKTVVELALTGISESFNVSGQVKLEYDGLAWFDLNVVSKTGSPVKIDYFGLESSFVPGAAALYHGAPDRSLNGYISAGSKNYPWQVYFWIGTQSGGLGFVNESRQMFNTSSAAAFTTEAGAKSTLYRVNFLQNVFRKEVKLSFGLQVTPVKPLPPDYSSMVTANYSQQGDSYFRKLAKYLLFSTVWRNNCNYMKYICDPGGIDYRILKNAVNYSHSKGVQAIPYFAPISFSEGVQPEFVDYYEEWIQTPVRQWKAESSIQVRCCVNSGYLDYLIWQLNKIQQKTGCDGFYFDGAWPVACSNPLHGCGYVDAAGVRQPTYAVRKIREFLRRAAVVAMTNSVKPQHWKSTRVYSGFPEYQVWIHVSGSIAPPMHSFSTAMFAGEWFKRAIRDGANYDKLLTIEKFIPRYISQPWGIPNYFLAILNPRSDQARYTDVALSYIVPFGVPLYPRYLNKNIVIKVLGIKDKFGSKQAEFYPPGRVPAGISLESDPRQVAAGFWHRADGAILIALGNCSHSTQNVIVKGDFSKFTHPYGSGKINGTQGKITVKLPANTLNLLVIERK